MQKVQGSSGASSPPQAGSALHSPQIPHVPVPTGAGFSTLAYNMPHMSPMMQMQMGVGMNVDAAQYGTGGGGQQVLHPQTQAMHQSVMRHPSPRPQQQGAYGGF